MMHYTVTEVGCEHFSFHRSSGNEADTPAHFIGMVAQLLVQFHEVLFQIKFKLKLAMRIPFVPSGIVISMEHIK